MNKELVIFEEPKLEFRYGQQMELPQDGLSLFGPFDADSSSHPCNITYGLIGTPEGISLFHNWSNLINSPIIHEEPSKRKLWPPFPGFEAAYSTKWPETPAWEYNIDGDTLIRASQHNDPNIRAFKVVEEYLKGISIVEKKDEQFNVIVCIVPDEVKSNCRPKSRIVGGWGRKIRKKEKELFQKGQKSLFEKWVDRSMEDGWSTDKYLYSVDFRRQIKARAMKYNVPIQIILESTINLQSGEIVRKGLTCLSDRAWNLATAIYYKSGGKPWKLASAREGVCYIGIAFRRTGIDVLDNTACCAAQMFLDTGDGIVFLGDEGPWYSIKEKQYHLNKESAEKLLSGILNTYSELEGKKLKEIFLHSHSEINNDEFEGYLNACPAGVKLIGVRVRSVYNDLRLYRIGKKPVIRGTFLKWSGKSGYLWGTGFKDRLGTYDGWETPAPLEITLQHGEETITQVAKDIFSLTKLNYNACKLGDSEPVTIKFSKQVGEILVSNPTIKEGRPRFKFYI